MVTERRAYVREWHGIRAERAVSRALPLIHAVRLRFLVRNRRWVSVGHRKAGNVGDLQAATGFWALTPVAMSSSILCSAPLESRDCFSL
jgi:hypothetical protein